MKKALTVIAFAVLAGTCLAKEHNYEKGTLVSMDSTSCGMQEAGSKTLAGEILGTDSQNKKTEQVLCQEYILQTNKLTYRIRPKDEKHAALLPIGETAQFRIHKDKLILRIPEGDGKEREYIVVSMTPREDAPKQAANAN